MPRLGTSAHRLLLLTAAGFLTACSTPPTTSQGASGEPATRAQDTPQHVDTAQAAHAPTQIDPSAQAVLDRMIKQYAPLDGVTVVARHQIKAPDRIIGEKPRVVQVAKPNKFQVDEDGRPIAVCDGTRCVLLNRQTGAMEEVPMPVSLPDAIDKIVVLGGGSIAGSGGLVAAMLSPDPQATLLDNVARVEHRALEQDDLLILHIREQRGIVRKDGRVALFIPRTGPAWITQADIIPPDSTIHTRIAFEQWTPMSSPKPSVATGAKQAD